MFSRETHSRKSIALVLFVMASFLVQYSNWILGTYIPYGLLLCAAVVLLCWERYRSGICDWQSLLCEINWVGVLWVPAVLVFGLSSFAGGLGMKEIIDIFTYVVCIFFVIIGSDGNSIRRALTVVVAFAVYYALSVWVQLLLPTVYDGYLMLLPETVVEKILELRDEYGSYVGFSTNTGFTAGHITAGMIAVIAGLFAHGKKNLIQKSVLLLFLGASLMLTGKRAHLLALVLVAVILFICSAGVQQRKKRLVVVAVLAAAGIFVLVLAINLGRFIPVIDRLAKTIEGILSGEDVTSGRTKLYAYALQLFFENPIFGIGWSRYRDVMVGVVTWNTEMDVHNVYLQLLAETGAVGFLLTVIPMVLTLMCTLMRIRAYQIFGCRKKVAVLFSLGYQIFFLIYGLTGNPLYDYNYVLLYFFACMIAVRRPKSMTGATSDTEIS